MLRNSGSILKCKSKEEKLGWLIGCVGMTDQSETWVARKASSSV